MWVGGKEVSEGVGGGLREGRKEGRGGEVEISSVAKETFVSTCPLLIFSRENSRKFAASHSLTR